MFPAPLRKKGLHMHIFGLLVQKARDGGGGGGGGGGESVTVSEGLC